LMVTKFDTSGVLFKVPFMKIPGLTVEFCKEFNR
jgi:hypothetical protein